MNFNPTILYQAPWVVPVASSIIPDGGVLVRGERIVAVAPIAQLRRRADRVVEVDGALMPQLVNCHAHLELSVFGPNCKELLQEGSFENFPDWIRALLAVREETEVAENGIADARALLRKMWEEGIGLILDTGNIPASTSIGDEGPVEVVFFQEMLGLTEKAAVERCRQLDTFAAERNVTAHAPYSSHPLLLQCIKKRCRAYRQLFSIHTAESAEETDFLTNGSGPFIDFLKERGVWDGTFRVPGLSPVPYLERLGLLDSETLCVHCVQVDDADIALLARSGARVCLCPESNRTLGVGKAPVAKMLAAGISPCLGTDSLASNPHCSLWREMRLLSQEHPGLDPQDIVAAATLNGARALGMEDHFGSLAAGRSARMLAVDQYCRTADELLQHLANLGDGVRLQPIGTTYV